jgi:hypothetical protein
MAWLNPAPFFVIPVVPVIPVIPVITEVTIYFSLKFYYKKTEKPNKGKRERWGIIKISES